MARKRSTKRDITIPTRRVTKTVRGSTVITCMLKSMEGKVAWMRVKNGHSRGASAEDNYFYVSFIIVLFLRAMPK